MSFPELFGALQTGVVDGQENPIPVILSAKFLQVQKHLSLTGHVYSLALLIVSPALWNKLSDAYKKAFTEAGKAASAAHRNTVNDDERWHCAAARGRHGGRYRGRQSGVSQRNDAGVERLRKTVGAANIRQIQEFK